MHIESLHDLQVVARARRHEIGLTQAAAASRAGVSRKWLSTFERGASAVELPLVLRLFAALQLRIDVVPGGPVRAGAAAANATPLGTAMTTDERDATNLGNVDLIDLDEHLRSLSVRVPPGDAQT